jgi:hypothetical protein
MHGITFGMDSEQSSETLWTQWEASGLKRDRIDLLASGTVDIKIILEYMSKS